MEIDYNQIVDFINKVGFPIFIVLILLWRDYKNDANHKEETKLFSEAIDNNTLAMTQMKTQLETFMQSIVQSLKHD